VLKKVISKFSDYPGRREVAKKMISLGMSVRQGGLYVADVEVKDLSLARAAGVDRRVVKATISQIEKDKDLSSFFSSLSPAGPFLKKVAKSLGMGVVEIEAGDGKSPGIIAKACSLIASRGIGIRQVYAEDPELSTSPTLVIITEKPISGALLKEFSQIPKVGKVSVF
jgi:uncharacterized protein